MVFIGKGVYLKILKIRIWIINGYKKKNGREHGRIITLYNIVFISYCSGPAKGSTRFSRQSAGRTASTTKSNTYRLMSGQFRLYIIFWSRTILCSIYVSRIIFVYIYTYMGRKKIILGANTPYTLLQKNALQEEIRPLRRSTNVHN